MFCPNCKSQELISFGGKNPSPMECPICGLSIEPLEDDRYLVSIGEYCHGVSDSIIEAYHGALAAASEAKAMGENRYLPIAYQE